MSHSHYKGYSLRNRIFWGFLLITLLTIMASSLISYIILRNNARVQNATEQQNKAEALMAALDYAVSHTDVQTEDLPDVLQNKIYEIADISMHDVILYDLKGKYLLSNRDPNLVQQKQLSIPLVNKILKTETRVDVQKYDEKLDAVLNSSYMLLKNNTLEPIAIVYFPSYHNESSSLEVVNRYLQYMLMINVVIIALSIWLSWLISRNLTEALMQFSDKMNKFDMFEDDLQPIKYYKNDELNSLVKGYNRMILQIQDQKVRLAITQKEEAWREMAKQVAHEVKNPLTPMKLTLQNFERKFNPEDPEIAVKLKKMTAMVIDQIDLVATVASAFSQFAQLPEKNNEVFNLNEEVGRILQLFNDERIFMHANKSDIYIRFDKIYMNRIITNLITNAQQARREDVLSVVNVDLEQFHKRIVIRVEDNGYGIPAEKIGRIFEPNFTSKSSGMGLGLTMVRKMVEDYQGEITVKSEIGKGSVFTITLPSQV